MRLISISLYSMDVFDVLFHLADGLIILLRNEFFFVLLLNVNKVFMLFVADSLPHVGDFTSVIHRIEDCTLGLSSLCYALRFVKSIRLQGVYCQILNYSVTNSQVSYFFTLRCFF